MKKRDLNKSLSNLDQCLGLLVNPRVDLKTVPFRNSKLTKILKRALCKSLVCLVVSVSQSGEKYQETLTSLQFAARIYRKPFLTEAIAKEFSIIEQEIVDITDKPPKKVRFELPTE